MNEHQNSTVNDPKTLHYWSLFDWANSSFALVIAVAIFPAFYTSTTESLIEIGSWSIANTTLYAWAITIAYIIIVLLTPLLSGIADVGGRRKAFLRFFTIMGGLSCMCLFFFDSSQKWLLGTSLFILSTIGFAGGLVFYNSYLPLITTEDRMDNISARGYAYGYIGSVLLLIGNIILITYPDLFGLPSSTFAVRLSFVTVGVWWIGFGLLSLYHLPSDNKRGSIFDHLSKGVREVKIVYGELRTHSSVIKFLISFFFYSAGVQTVLYLASTFAEKELAFSTNELLLTILILQILAIAGAYLFAFVSKQFGNKLSLITMLSIWLIICLSGYGITTKVVFFILAGGVGLVMGGIQSLSRSTYAKYVKNGTKDITSYFSIYDILEKLSIVAGTFIFGLVEQLTGGMRNSLLSLAIFFIVGIVILTFTRVKTLNLDPND